MTSVFQSVNNCPRVDISITNGGGTITEFFSKDGGTLNISDASFSSSYKGPQQNIGRNQQNGSDLGWGYVAYAYPTGFSIVRDEGGNIVLFNKGDINIDSAIDLTSVFHGGDLVSTSDTTAITKIHPDLTIVSADGDININADVKALGRITCMAKKGEIVVGAGVTVRSFVDRVIMMGDSVQNQGSIIGLQEVVLCDSSDITNTGSTQGRRIVADHISGAGTLFSDRVITDDFIISGIASGPASGTLVISALSHTQYTTTSGTLSVSDAPDANGVFFSGSTIKIITTQNVQINVGLTLSKNLEIITPGAVNTQAISAPARSITVLANQITTSDVDVSNVLPASTPGAYRGGNITLISQTNITTGNLKADGGGNGAPGVDQQYADHASNPNGTGGSGGTNCDGGQITLIACGDINTQAVSANGGGNGGNGGSSSNNPTGAPGDNTGQSVTVGPSGSSGGTGGQGGAGGTDADGGSIILIACGNITAHVITADGGGNGGNGGACQGNTGGQGGTGIGLDQNMNTITVGGPGGNGANGTDSLNTPIPTPDAAGGNGGANCGGGSVVVIACGAINASNISAKGGAFGGNGGAAISNTGGAAGGPDSFGGIGGIGGLAGNGGSNADGGIITLISCVSIRAGLLSASGGANGGLGGQAEGNIVGSGGPPSPPPYPNVTGSGGNGGHDADGGTITLITCGKILTEDLSVIGGGSGGAGASNSNSPPSNSGSRGSDADAGSISLIACRKITTGQIFGAGGSRGGASAINVNPGADGAGGDGSNLLLHTYAPISLTNFDLSHVSNASDGAIQLFSLVFINRNSDFSQVFPVFISDLPIVSISDTTNKVIVSDLNVIVPQTASDGDVAVIQCITSDEVFFTPLYLRENSISISELRAGMGAGCQNSFFDIFFDLDVVGGSGTAHIDFVIDGSDFGGSDYSPGSDHIFSVKMSVVPSDYVITAHAKDHLGVTVFDTKTKTVTVNPAPAVSIAVTPSTSISQGQTATLTASGATSYLWSTGAITASIVVSTGGTYTVKGFLDTCSDSASVVMTVTPVPPPIVVRPPPPKNFFQDVVLFFLILYGVILLFFLFNLF